MNVNDIVAGAKDSAGALIEDVYARSPPQYAVYSTKQRVLVEFADSPAGSVSDAEQAQRQALSVLNPLRGEINGLMDSWRHEARRDSSVRRYSRRVADAIIVALEKDTTDAMALLQEVKADLLDERQSVGRRQYLLVGAGAAGLVLAIAGIWAALANSGACASGCADAVRHTWSVGQLLGLAVAGGAVGALLSTALGIRGRTILTDIRFVDNAIDAGLRILVGVIAAPALVCLALSGAVTITIGGAVLGRSFDDSHNGWIIALVLAFVAGFLERLVPDLLAKASAGAPAPPPSETMTPGKAPRPDIVGQGTVVGADAEAAPSPPDPDAPDGCASGLEPDVAGATGDADLPATTGG